MADDSLGADQSFQIFRGITEITGNRIAGLLATDAFWNRQTAINTELMLGLLGGASIETPGLEALADFIAQSLPATVVIESLDFNFDFSGTTVDEEEARTAGRVAAEEFDKTLGDSYVVKRRSFGTRPVRTS